MAFDDDFRNLDAFLREGVSAMPNNAERVRTKLDALITALGAGANRRGGTIYIPRVTGGQLWVDVTRALHIPREITVAVAPGVVIVPVFTGADEEDGTHCLEIEGVLDAPIATVFATRGWFARQSPAGAARYHVGAVRLSSPHLERVHPEWWGAGDPSDPERPSDFEAITAALRAALRDRVRVREGMPGSPPLRLPLRPLPVELRGSYTLGRTLEIHAHDLGTDQGLELRGAAGTPDAPTFRCTEGFTYGDPMVVIRGMKAITLEDLRFDGAERAATCLRITDQNGAMGTAAAAAPAERAHLLRRCGFQGALGPLASYAVSAPPGMPAELRVEGLHLEHCTFRPKASLEAPDAALRLDGLPSTAVEVRGCTFRGEASAMIHAVTCSLTVASCHFDNERLPFLPREAASTDMLHERGPTGGVDLYLDGPDGVAVATLYAQDCRSTSPQFLVTRPGATGPGGHVTVVGLHYTRRPGAVLRGEPIYTHEDRPRWLWDVFEVTPVTFQPQTESKFEAPPTITSQKLPVNGANDPSGLPTTLLPGTSAGSLPERNGFPKGGLWRPLGGKALTGEPPVPAILWRLSGTGGSHLMLMGCRFDFPSPDVTLPVRGTPEAGPIVDLGVLRDGGSENPISVDHPERRVEVPTWPRYALRGPGM